MIDPDVRLAFLRKVMKRRGAWAFRSQKMILTCNVEPGCTSACEHVFVFEAREPAFSLSCGEHFDTARGALQNAGVPDVTFDRSWRGVCPPIGGAM